MTNEATGQTLTVSEFIEALDTSPNLNIGAPRVFSTGSRGYTVNTRLIIHGKLYIGTMNLVEAGSKPLVAPTAPAANGANPDHAAATQNGAVTTSRRNRDK